MLQLSPTSPFCCGWPGGVGRLALRVSGPLLPSQEECQKVCEGHQGTTCARIRKTCLPPGVTVTRVVHRCFQRTESQRRKPSLWSHNHAQFVEENSLQKVQVHAIRFHVGLFPSEYIGTVSLEVRHFSDGTNGPNVSVKRGDTGRLLSESQVLVQRNSDEGSTLIRLTQLPDITTSIPTPPFLCARSHVLQKSLFNHSIPWPTGSKHSTRS